MQFKQGVVSKSFNLLFCIDSPIEGIVSLNLLELCNGVDLPGQMTKLSQFCNVKASPEIVHLDVMLYVVSHFRFVISKIDCTNARSMSVMEL